jgi:predicted CxxxxCH...CXXCH cytochrome family protein
MHSRKKAWLFAALAIAALPLAGCDEGTDQEGARTAGRAAALTAENVCLEGDPACTPSGAHAAHDEFACAVCHAVPGRLAFQRAYFQTQHPGAGLPTFSAATKTCSNVACHAVPAGVYDYWVVGGDGESVAVSVVYGGPATAGSANWYAPPGTGCDACHRNPAIAPEAFPYVTYVNPATGLPYYAWHSGFHGNQGPAGAYNQCQLCHLDATGSGGVGTSIVAQYASLHRNGVVDVNPQFRSQCFGCH